MEAIFKRYEFKYMISETQKAELITLFKKYMNKDKYDNYTIYNLYYDTPEYLLIRRSIEKPIYKEKLRIRSYGKVTKTSKVFLELKKKYDRVVYKRRMTVHENEVAKQLQGKAKETTQIGKEIAYFVKLYKGIAPKVFISYDRQAFSGKEDRSLRITFDNNVLWRDYDLSLSSDSYGTAILPEGKILMEIKISNPIPLWLTGYLTENGINRTGFSKYGTAYKQIISTKREKKI